MSATGFEWDKQKSEANFAKHRIDFADVVDFDFENALEVEQLHDGETRIMSIGPLGNRICVLIWTMRDDTIRVISLRKANKREVARYAVSIAKR